MKTLAIRIICFFAIGISLFIFSEPVEAREGFGAGFDFNPNAVRISARHWFSKMNGVEIGFGPTAKMEDFKFDDMSIQGKVMFGLSYDRFRRSYIGIVARYTLVKDLLFDKDLPAAGAFGGNEWYLGKFRNHGVAIEGGFIYGKVKKQGFLADDLLVIEREYKEFPLYLTFSYKFYFK